MTYFAMLLVISVALAALVSIAQNGLQPLSGGGRQLVWGYSVDDDDDYYYYYRSYYSPSPSPSPSPSYYYYYYYYYYYDDDDDDYYYYRSYYSPSPSPSPSPSYYYSSSYDSYDDYTLSGGSTAGAAIGGLCLCVLLFNLFLCTDFRGCFSCPPCGNNNRAFNGANAAAYVPPPGVGAYNAARGAANVSVRTHTLPLPPTAPPSRQEAEEVFDEPSAFEFLPETIERLGPNPAGNTGSASHGSSGLQFIDAAPPNQQDNDGPPGHSPGQAAYEEQAPPSYDALAAHGHSDPPLEEGNSAPAGYVHHTDI
jgi:hypothetical protein